MTIAASAFVSLAIARAIGRKRGGLSLTFDAAAGLERFLGDGGAALVAEHRDERGDEADGVADVFEAALAVRLDAGDAAAVQDDRGVAQQREAEEQVEGDDRLGHVELEFARLRTPWRRSRPCR